MERTGERRDATDGLPAAVQPLIPPRDVQAPPLRSCLLSGGLSRRMGQDKALLPHPSGGSWLEHSLMLLLELAIPVTLYSRHERHLRLAWGLSAALAHGSASHPPAPDSALNQPSGTPCPEAPAAPPPMAVSDVTAAAGSDRIRCPDAGLESPRIEAPEATSSPATASGGESAVEADSTGKPDAENATPQLIALAEPPPWEGPLLALHRLMERYPEQRLLLCPVDMPWLTPQVLRTLLQSAAEQPQRIHLAHDGVRLQPLLGIYPSRAPIRAHLAAAVERGERRLQSWLATQVIEAVPLDPRAIRNVNRPEAVQPADSTSS